MQEKSAQASAGDYLFALPQYLLPHHFISRLTLWLTRVRAAWFKNAFMKWFINHFDVDMSQAVETDYQQYPHFNAFFTRPLKPEARPIAGAKDVLCCPVDGAVSQAGAIEQDTIFQAKGHDYSVQTLLGGYADITQSFHDGQFATLYLSPRDYHRIHMPIDGTLKQMVYVPGRLFSVNQQTVRCIPNLFARNERVVALFDTAVGPMAMVLVGAINVACIETVWHGVVTPPHKQPVHRWVYDDQAAIQLEKGQEMGRFNMGSTVICVFADKTLQFDSAIKPGNAIRMGQTFAAVTPTE